MMRLMNTLKSVGARMQPCRTLTVVEPFPCGVVDKYFAVCILISLFN